MSCEKKEICENLTVFRMGDSLSVGERKTVDWFRALSQNAAHGAAVIAILDKYLPGNPPGHGEDI